MQLAVFRLVGSDATDTTRCRDKGEGEGKRKVRASSECASCKDEE